MASTMSQESVQHFLDHTHDYSRPLTVIFLKKDGTQGKTTGLLEKSDSTDSPRVSSDSLQLFHSITILCIDIICS
jgi:hypothetical protein